MKKLLLIMLLVVALTLSACSITGFIPATSNNNCSNTCSSDLELNDSFNFLDENQSLVENKSLDGNQSYNESELEEIAKENEDQFILVNLEVVEGDLVSLTDLFAVDPDGDDVTYEYYYPFNEEGFWQTNEGDAGKYLVDVTASDGLLLTTEQVQIIVKPSNKGPVIDCPSSFEVSEGDLIQLPCTIYDKEGDEVTYEVTGFMTDLTYQSTYADAGEYTVTITASDGMKSTVKKIDLLIDDNNRLPVISNVSMLEVTEGEQATVTFEASDEDGQELTVTYPDQFDENGVWKTVRGDAGTYEFELKVSDGIDVVSAPFTVKVNKLNVAPIIAPIETITVNEGDLIELPINVTDEDNDDVEVTISGFMNDSTYQTTYDDAGEYAVTIMAFDGQNTVSLDVGIVINNVNRPPVFIVQ